MAGGFGAASLPLISAIALLVGAIFLILGFAAPNWANDGVHHVGLWRYGRCVLDTHKGCYAQDQPSIEGVPVWLHVVRALECTAVILVSIPLVILPVYMYVALGMYYRCMMGTMSAMCLFSAITGIIGVIVYSVNMTKNGWTIEWALIMSIVGSAIIFIGFLVLLVSMISKRPESVREPWYPTTIYVDPKKNRLYTIQLEEED